MIHMRHCDRIRFAGFLVFMAVLFLPWSSLGQESGINTSGASNCTIADFDTNLSFANEPSSYYAIIVDKGDGGSWTIELPVATINLAYDYFERRERSRQLDSERN